MEELKPKKQIIGDGVYNYYYTNTDIADKINEIVRWINKHQDMERSND